MCYMINYSYFKYKISPSKFTSFLSQYCYARINTDAMQHTPDGLLYCISDPHALCNWLWLATDLCTGYQLKVFSYIQLGYIGIYTHANTSNTTYCGYTAMYVVSQDAVIVMIYNMP